MFQHAIRDPQPRRIFLDCTNLIKGSFGYNPHLVEDFPIVDLLTYLLNLEIRHQAEIINLEENLKEQLFENLDLFVADCGFDLARHRLNDWIHDDQTKDFIQSLIRNLSIYISQNPYFTEINNGFYVNSMASSTIQQEPRYEFILEAF